MFKNYIKITFRNLFKHKVYSGINILGLAIGMAASILLLLFIQDELSYDKHYEKHSALYRVASHINFKGEELRETRMPPVLGKTLKDEIPEVVDFVRIRQMGDKIVKYENIGFKEKDVDIVYTDNSIFNLFSINIIKGERENPLKDPFTIAISESAAEKYFGNEDPIGKTLLVDNWADYIITAVYKDIPRNTHFGFDLFLSMESLEDSKVSSWLNSNYSTYILMANNVDPDIVESKLLPIFTSRLDEEFKKMTGKSLIEFMGEESSATYFLQPVENIHLYSDLKGELDKNGDITYVYIFSIVAVFILLIACINFMNISTARAATRAKEVGIRKVLGSHHGILIKQFLTESFAVTIISMFIGIGIVEIALPYFNNLTGKEIILHYFENHVIQFSIISIILIVSLFAGSYPAFVLSSFNPAIVLKGKVKAGVKSGYLRGGLVVFQFASSIILIIGTLVVFNQLDYIQSKDLGYDKENVLVVQDAYLLGNQLNSFKHHLLADPSILSATVTNYLPVKSNYNSNVIHPTGRIGEGKVVQNWHVDYDYLKTMGMKISEGRFFNKEYSADTTSIVINQALVKRFGIKQPIGAKFSRQINMRGDFRIYNVIGVVDNFNFESLKNEITPLAMYLRNNNGAVSFKVETAKVGSVISKIENKWKQLAPGQPLNYSFLDERFNMMYFSEARIGDIFSVFASLAIFIACLGLFSLSAFTAEQKTKEIGIRKVLGSSIIKIVKMLSVEFIKLIAIAFVIAVPISYYFMNEWLNDFQYRTDISIILLLGSGFIALAIAMLTVSYHAVKAALTNPIESLRNE